MSRALRELERDLAATRQTRAAVAAGDVVDMEDPDVHATDDAWLNRPTLFDDLARTESRDELAEEDARAAADAARHARLRETLAEAAARAAQAVTFRLPDDVARQVGDFTVDATCLPRDELCACRTARHLALRLGEVPRVALVSCDSCGKCRALTSGPGELEIAGPPPRFAESRHFLWGVHGSAIRHPMSTWHNFRAAVADEWVTGTARYRVQLGRITRGAIAIGVASARAAINDTNHWIPGGELETVALVSGVDALPSGLYGRLYCDKNCPSGARCQRCANGVHLLPHKPWRELQMADVVDVVIHLRDVQFFHNCQLVGHLPKPLGRLRVCVGLMYASDEVRIARLSPAPAPETPVAPPLVAWPQVAPPASCGVLDGFDPVVTARDGGEEELDRFNELTEALPTTHMFLLVAMMAELYALPRAKDAYELVMRGLRPHDHWRSALKDRDQAIAAKVATAMVSVSPAGDVLRAVAAAKEKVAAASRG
jgi:hypothetical protein